MTQKVTYPPTLQRLIKLLDAGYSIPVRASWESPNCVILEHPASLKRIREKSLTLYEDGDVMGNDEHEDGTHLLVHVGDHEAFDRLIASTPRPTWWDLNNGPFYTVFAWITIATFMFIFYMLVNFVVDFLRPLWT